MITKKQLKWTEDDKKSYRKFHEDLKNGKIILVSLDELKP